ncbi:MAG: hypothetical protein WBC88_03095, partial [Candidatus Zixiibacteriota bacterium]
MRQAQIRMKSAFVFFILVLCLGFSPSEASDGLQMRIWTEKSNFLTHEPIVVHFRVTNIGDREYCINLSEMSEDFVIEDHQGRGYVSHLKGMDMGGDLLGPGETRRNAVEVSGLYGVVNKGEYACYCRTIGCPAVLNSQRVTSDTIQFKVVEPKGEEKEALHLFLEAEKLVWAR